MEAAPVVMVSVLILPLLVYVLEASTIVTVNSDNPLEIFSTCSLLYVFTIPSHYNARYWFHAGKVLRFFLSFGEHHRGNIAVFVEEV